MERRKKLEKIFEKVLITNPRKKGYGIEDYIPLKKAVKEGWFITDVFGSDIYIVRKDKGAWDKQFACKYGKIIFLCDKKKAEENILKYAEQQYKKHKKYLLGL